MQMQTQDEETSDVAVEGMDYINDLVDNGAGAYHDTEEVVLTPGSGGGGIDKIDGGSGKGGQFTTTATTSTRSPGHRRRRSSFLVSHGVSSFWYGLYSVVVLVLVLVSTRGEFFSLMPSTLPSDFPIPKSPVI